MMWQVIAVTATLAAIGASASAFALLFYFWKRIPEGGCPGE